VKRPAAPAPVPAAPAPTDTAADPSSFPYRDWVDARAALEAALHAGPFYAQVIGASGTGKTSLARELARGLDRHQHQLLYLSTPKVSLLGVARYFAMALRVTPRRSSLETVKVLSDALQAQPARLVAWIDEAESMPAETLCELRSLAEFDQSCPQLFSVVFSGTPGLQTLLDAPALFPLRRRICTRLSLAGLRRDELDAFLVHRFGSKEARRVPAALRDELFERCRAAPALVDRVVRHALSRAGQGPAGDDHLREALDAAAL